MDANHQIRDAIEKSGFRYWQIAAEIGIHRVTFCEWLRLPLSDERFKKIQSAIDHLTERGAMVNA